MYGQNVHAGVARGGAGEGLKFSTTSDVARGLWMRVGKGGGLTIAVCHGTEANLCGIEFWKRERERERERELVR